MILVPGDRLQVGQLFQAYSFATVPNTFFLPDASFLPGDRRQQDMIHG
jgi:hypothetical protein